MAYATVSGPGAPKAHAPAVKISAVAEAKPRSVFDNLILTNKAMLGQIKKDVVGVARNPLGTLGSMLKNLLYPFRHPVEAFKGMVAGIKKDPLDGAFSSAATVTAMAWIGAVVVGAVAVAAAPLTGGASLAVAATAFAVGDAFALGCIAADAGGILLHQYRGATAKSSGEAIAEGELLASWVEDEALNLLAWKGTNLAEAGIKKAIQAQAGRLGGRAIAEGVGLMGVYDAPAAVAGKAAKAAGKASHAVRPKAPPVSAGGPVKPGPVVSTPGQAGSS